MEEMEPDLPGKNRPLRGKGQRTWEKPGGYPGFRAEALWKRIPYRVALLQAHYKTPG